jgi:hypothetical protein
MSWLYQKISLASALFFLCAALSMSLFIACGDSVNVENQAETLLDESFSLKSESSFSSKVKCFSSEKNSSLSKTAYSELCRPNDEECPYAGIPRIVIETENHQEIEDSETEIPAKMQIWGEKEAESEIMDLTIRGRGNSTWWYPKKPYAIKLGRKMSLLGMPEAKKWILLANYRDRTLMRNALAFEVARQTDIGWTPQGHFVEIVLNGTFIGTYFLCEKIEIKKNRLDLGSEGYLLEFDTYYDAENKFRSKIKDLPINIKRPDSLSEIQFSYIQSFIDTVETYLYEKKDESIDIEKYIDFKSFALYWIVNEIAKNTELSHPKSVYMNKPQNEALKAGPVWDFDFATFVFNESLRVKNSLWYDSLFEISKFKEEVKYQWELNKDKFLDLAAFIDSLAVYTKKSNERNILLWPIKEEKYMAGDEKMDFDEAIDRIKSHYIKRINLMDELIYKL